MHAFRNVDAARLILGGAAGSEDITLATSRNKHPHGVFRHGLFSCATSGALNMATATVMTAVVLMKNSPSDCAPFNQRTARLTSISSCAPTPDRVVVG